MNRRLAFQLFYFLAACCLLALPACRHLSSGRKAAEKYSIKGAPLFSEEEAQAFLTAAFPARDSAAAPDSLSAAMAYVYARAGYQPIWIAPDGLTDNALLLLRDLDSLSNDGLDPQGFGAWALHDSFGALRAGGDASQAIALDTLCTRAYLEASRSLLFGVLRPRQADSLWFHSNDSAWNAPALLLGMASGKGYPTLDSFRSRIPLYDALRNAYAHWHRLAAKPGFAGLNAAQLPDSALVALTQQMLPSFQPAQSDSLSAAAQARIALGHFLGKSKKDISKPATLRMSADSIAGRIAANMERLRWLPRQLEGRYLLVNIPQMMLFFFDDGQDALDMRVVVGRPSRQTPVLNARLSSIILSPSWGVPPTIMKKDVLPGISKSGAHYLKRKGLRVFDRKGRRVSADAINEQNYRKFLLRQPPGEDNALGEIKFNLPNRWDIYLHDTPHRGDFGRDYRAKSSGCIRLQKPHELAGMLLREVEGRESFSPGRIDSIISTRKTRSLSMQHHIPVHIVYLSATEDREDGGIRLLPDIYHRDGKLMRLLARQ